MIAGIDCGNSTIKFYFFENNILKNRQIIKSDAENLKKSLREGILEYCSFVIISSVVKPLEQIISSYCVARGTGLYSVSQKKLPGLIIDYKTPETLGADRILNCAAAMRLFPGENVLITDAGTAVTIDILLNGNTFSGGMIFPGPQTAAESLFRGTDRLPLTPWQDCQELVGKSTQECISSGIFNGWSLMIKGLCSSIEGETGNASRKIITGGHAESLKNSSYLQEFLCIKDFHAEGFLQIYSAVYSGI